MLVDHVVFADGLTKRFTPTAGVEDIDLSVDRGQVLGLIGPSGSGKTTTVRLLAGLLAPDSGEASVFGTNPLRFDKNDRARIGYMPQNAVLYPDLTLRHNLGFAGSLYGMRRDRQSRIDELVEFVELEGAIDRLPGAASGGEKRRVSLASTLIHSPDLIFLDEPTAGLDPVLRRKFWQHFQELAETGRSLIVTTQYVGEAAYCDHVGVLADGRIIALDTPEGLRRMAFGGEPVDIVFSHTLGPGEERYLDELETRGPPQWIDDRSVRLVVDDAGTAAPEIAQWASDRNLALEKTEAHVPPFDDVFVELIERLVETEGESHDGR